MNIELLSEKAREILTLIIDTYIKTGNPVGSSSLVDKYKLSYSSATVRNTMSELMKLGYLRQPHISAGRIPTDKGIRFYTDTLISKHNLTKKKERVLFDKYFNIDGTIDEIVQKITKALSKISNYTGLATVPDIRVVKINSAEIISLGSKKLLIILVFEGGLTEKTVVRTERNVSKEILNKMSDYLNKLSFGLTLKQLNDYVLSKLKNERQIYNSIFESIVKVSTKVLEENQRSDVYIEGQMSMLKNHNYSKRHNLEVLFNAFEEKDHLIRILEDVMRDKTTKVFVGEENGIPEGYSIIAAPYGPRSKLGSLGIIGPSSMDYSRIIPLVNFTAKYVSNLVSEEGG